MLVLSRKVDQDILIGDDIFVSVVDIRGDKVRLGVDAPRYVPVHRREVYETINGEGRAAARNAAADRIADRLSVTALHPLTLKPWTREQIIALSYVDDDCRAELEREIKQP